MLIDNMTNLFSQRQKIMDPYLKIGSRTCYLNKFEQKVRVLLYGTSTVTLRGWLWETVSSEGSRGNIISYVRHRIKMILAPLSKICIHTRIM